MAACLVKGNRPDISLIEQVVTSVSELEMADGIPDLELPPPIIPLRRYGHNFLEYGE
jgi:CDK inhibitor PHO81